MILTGTILTWIIEIYTVLLIVRMLMSWVPLLIRGFEPRGVLAVVFEAVYTVTESTDQVLRSSGAAGEIRQRRVLGGVHHRFCVIGDTPASCYRHLLVMRRIHTPKVRLSLLSDASALVE